MMYVVVQLHPAACALGETTRGQPLPVMSLNGGINLRVDPDHDRTLEAFASCRRRCVIYYFLLADESTTAVSDLRDFVLDNDPQASDEQVVSTDLFHRTLPKLDATELIDFDPRSETVRFRGLGEWRPVVEHIHTLES